MEKFEKLGLSRQLLDVLKEAGFEKPSKIQEKAIPLVLKGKDIIGGSATGSGKTLAFASAIIENLKPNNNVQALILTPTRELAEQVSKSIEYFSKNKPLNVLAVYGGVNIEAQIRKIPKTDVIVGTPGRILDHMRRTTLKLNKIKFLVLDEVDRMFDMGFHKDVEMIIGECPKERQTMLFSATISADMDYLAQKYTKDAEEISVESHVDPSKLKQIYYDVPTNMKFSLLVHLLKQERSGLVMVFCSTRRNVDFVANNLERVKINAKGIHGGMPQNKRIRTLKEFHSKGVGVLVCTDVAARGLDIKDVSHVYNYDLPTGTDDYIHRIGRTARAGKEGKAISILVSRDYENFGNILKSESLHIAPEELPNFKKVEFRVDSHRRSGGPRRDSYRSHGRSDKRPSRGSYSKGPRRTNERRPIQGRHGPRDRRPSRGKDSHRRPSRGKDSHRGPSRGKDSHRGPRKPDSRGKSNYSRRR